MSGPIVRRYGFPNFEKIFGERPLEHGVEEAEKSQDTRPDDSTAPQPAPGAASNASAPKQPPEGTGHAPHNA